MPIGPIFALLASLLFAGNLVTVTRGIHLGGKTGPASAITVFTGVLVYLLLLPITGAYRQLASASWQAITLLAVAGALNFSLSRYLFFSSIRIIGANRSISISRSDILFAAFFGIVFFQETITLPLVLGSLAIMLGATIVNLVTEEGTYKFQLSGAILAVTASLCGATSSLLVKSAMKEVTSPLAATFVSYTAAAVVWLVIIIARRDQRVSLLTLNRRVLALFIITGVLLLTGHLLSYAALAISPVSVIQPLLGTVVLFTFLLSFLVNRRTEVFSWRMFTGILMVLAGIILVFV